MIMTVGLGAILTLPLSPPWLRLQTMKPRVRRPGNTCRLVDSRVATSITQLRSLQPEEDSAKVLVFEHPLPNRKIPLKVLR